MLKAMAGLAGIAVAVACWTADAPEARAEVVLEQYEAGSPRPEEADAIMEVLRDEFSHNYLVSRPRHVAAAMLGAPRPAIEDATLTSEALIDELELAVKSYIKVDYVTARVQLTNALAHADANYGLIVSDAKAKYAMSRAQVALALTWKKLADSPKHIAAKKELDVKAEEAMTTYIRSSRDPVVRRMFGPPGEQLYNDVRKNLDPAKRTNLVISVNEPDAQITVNGLLVGQGATYAADQLPGLYCLVIRVGHQMLRYDVTLRTGIPVSINIDWAFDTTLNISERWVGLMLPKNHSNTYVRSVSKRLGGQSSLIFVGVRRERGYLVVYGYVYERAHTGGALRWSGETHVTSARDEMKLRELATFLSTGKVSRSILPIGSPENPPSSEPRPWLAYAAGAGSVGALALGGFSLSKEYGCNRDSECKYAYPRAAVVGYTSIGIGVGLGALAVYLLVHEPKSGRASGVTVTPRSGAGATISFTGEF